MTRRRVEFTLAAERDLASLFEYVSTKSSERIADGFISRIVAYCTSIADFPIRGRLREDILPGLRVLGFERRLTIAYIAVEDAIVIEGVFYGGRDVEARWRGDGD